MLLARNFEDGCGAVVIVASVVADEKLLNFPKTFPLGVVNGLV